MVVLIGGISSLHDPLLAAALRARGVNALPLETPRYADLEVGRALLPRSTPNPGLYLVGAALRQLRAIAQQRNEALEAVASRSALLCVTGRYFHHISQHREAFSAAGLPAPLMVALEFGSPDAPLALAHAGVTPDAKTLHSLLEAAIAGDVLRVAGCAASAAFSDPTIDAVLWSVRDRCALAIERGEGLPEALATLQCALAAMTPRLGPCVRVRLTGDLFASMTDGDGADGVTRTLARRGAWVTPPTLAEWLLLWLFRARAQARGSLQNSLSQAMKVVRAAYRRLSTAAGLAPTALVEPGELAELARGYYPSALLDAPGFVEAGLFLAATRDLSAELLLSVKAFATTPSSAVSDALLHALARRSPVGFLTIETNGDARAQVESRIDLALDLCLSALRRARAAQGAETNLALDFVTHRYVQVTTALRASRAMCGQRL